MAHITSCRFVIDIQLSAIFVVVVNKLMLVVLPFREHIITGMLYIRSFQNLSPGFILNAKYS